MERRTVRPFFTIHYIETFIIPKWVKEYTIRPSGRWEGKEGATIKARVRVQPEGIVGFRFFPYVILLKNKSKAR